MIRIYRSPSCSSCRKVKAWFNEHDIPYEEVNILKHELTEDDLKDRLNKSLDGTDEIISTRSKVIQEQKIDIDSMSFKELLSFIKQNPTILKRPIIVNDTSIQVGYNADEIEIFERDKRAYKKARQIAKETCSAKNCPEYKNCIHRFQDRIQHAATEKCEGDCGK